MASGAVPTDILMPRLSDSMEEGRILKWMKRAGDEVSVGEELVEIETDKANMVYESDAAGTLIEITASEGSTLPIGAVIARIGRPGDAPSGNGVRAERPGEAEPADARASAPASPEPDRVAATRVRASPMARRLARKRGVELSGVIGSGPGGRITKVDIEGVLTQGSPQAAAPYPPRPETPPAPSLSPAPAGEGSGESARGPARTVALTKLQSTVARRMAESTATAPHFFLDAEIDMSRAVAARASLKASAAEGEVVPSLNDMVVKAVAIALREHPRANSAYRDGALELYSRVNVGVAVAAQDALMVPTIFDADRKGLRQVAQESRSLAQRVRDGTVTPPELSGGTFTVSTLGMYVILTLQAVINPPQAGILAVGEVAGRPVARDGEVTTAQLMRLNLACDHRILYGAEGALFLGRVRELLEEPVRLAL